MKTATVTPAQRIAANAKVRELRANNHYSDAMVLETAIMWESFPNLYTTDQLMLATELLTSEWGSDASWNAGCAIYIIISEKK